jgi:hypothetical protein
MIFKHLESDCRTEIEVQEENVKRERHKKNKAASLAANFRAQETGARAAEVGLKLCGKALEDAKIAAQQAAEEYAEKAREQVLVCLCAHVHSLISQTLAWACIFFYVFFELAYIYIYIYIYIYMDRIKPTIVCCQTRLRASTEHGFRAKGTHARV